MSNTLNIYDLLSDDYCSEGDVEWINIQRHRIRNEILDELREMRRNVDNMVSERLLSDMGLEHKHLRLYGAKETEDEDVFYDDEDDSMDCSDPVQSHIIYKIVDKEKFFMAKMKRSDDKPEPKTDKVSSLKKKVVKKAAYKRIKINEPTEKHFY